MYLCYEWHLHWRLYPSPLYSTLFYLAYDCMPGTSPRSHFPIWLPAFTWNHLTTRCIGGAICAERTAFVKAVVSAITPYQTLFIYTFVCACSIYVCCTSFSIAAPDRSNQKSKSQSGLRVFKSWHHAFFLAYLFFFFPFVRSLFPPYILSFLHTSYPWACCLYRARVTCGLLPLEFPGK